MLCFSLLSKLKTAKNLISSACSAGAVLLLVVLKQTQGNNQTQSIWRKWTRGLMWFKTCSNIPLSIVHPFCTCSVLHKCTISISLLKALVQSQLRAFWNINVYVTLTVHLYGSNFKGTGSNPATNLQHFGKKLWNIYMFYTEAVDQLQI